MFEKYLCRVESKDAGNAQLLSSSLSSGRLSIRDDFRANRVRSKTKASTFDKSVKLTAEQKCDIAQREIEELREEIERLKEDSEKVLDTYKVVDLFLNLRGCMYV